MDDRSPLTHASSLIRRPATLYSRFARWLGSMMPKGLYARSLIIIIAPVVILQSVIAYVFMERHYQTVTRRLSQAVASDIAALIDVYESLPQENAGGVLERIAVERLGFVD